MLNFDAGAFSASSCSMSVCMMRSTSTHEQKEEAVAHAEQSTQLVSIRMRFRES